MLIPSMYELGGMVGSSLSRRVNANSQRVRGINTGNAKLIKKGEC